jgi:hypothetical protein
MLTECALGIIGPKGRAMVDTWHDSMILQSNAHIRKPKAQVRELSGEAEGSGCGMGDTDRAVVSSSAEMTTGDSGTEESVERRQGSAERTQATVNLMLCRDTQRGHNRCSRQHGRGGMLKRVTIDSLLCGG